MTLFIIIFFDEKHNDMQMLTYTTQAMLADVRCFLLLSYDGHMHMQKVSQRDQTKQCASHHCLKDVSTTVKELT